MLASILLEECLIKIDEEVNQLLNIPENNEVAGNEISEALNMSNYTTISLEYLKAIDKLLCEQIDVKLFLKKLLKTVQKIDVIDDDFEIEESFKYCHFNKDIISHLFVENENIKNDFFYKNKVVILSSLPNQFEDFLNSLLSEQNHAKKLLYICKALLDNISYQKDDDKDRIIFLPNCSDTDIDKFNTNQNELISYIKLCILFEGKSFHKHFNYNNSLNTSGLVFDYTKEYAEFNEVFFILSEYNKSEDLLNKYFLLYTVVENFMYRQPIAKMINITNEFNIRDFQFFYKQIATREIDKISDLFKEIKTIPYDTTHNTIFDLIKFEIKEFKDSGLINFSDLNELFRKINVRKNATNLNDNELKGFINSSFHNIVYMLRNTILHNTETEFHLTHFELSQHEYISVFLQKLIIPLLEKIILHMILNNEPLIKYTQSELILYKK